MVSEKDGIRFYAKDESGHNAEVASFPADSIVGITEESSFVSKGK